MLTVSQAEMVAVSAPRDGLVIPAQGGCRRSRYSNEQGGQYHR